MTDQRVLSDRVKTAIKTALATVLAYGVALSMDWEHAYWAAFAVAFCTLSTVGESLNKGLLRLSGTLLGSLAAITLIALFPQDRWLFLIGMSIFTGFCTYMMPGTSRWYFWYVAGFSVPLLALAGGADPLNDFQTVITRSEETTLGIVSYSLVWLLIWPTSSREALEDAVRRLAAAHRQLAAHYLTPTIGETHDAGPEALRRQTTQVLARLGGLLDGAEIDSYEVSEARHAWRRLIHQHSQLASTSERVRQSSADVSEVERLAFPGVRVRRAGLQDIFCNLSQHPEAADFADFRSWLECAAGARFRIRLTCLGRFRIEDRPSLPADLSGSHANQRTGYARGDLDNLCACTRLSRVHGEGPAAARLNLPRSSICFTARLPVFYAGLCNFG